MERKKKRIEKSRGVKFISLLIRNHYVVRARTTILVQCIVALGFRVKLSRFT